MGNVVLDIAKEISLAIIAKFSIPGAPNAEDFGERYGKLFQNVLKQVVDGLEEVGYIEPDNQENLRGTGQLLRMYEEPVKPAQDIILARLNAIRQKFNILEQQIEPDNQENLRGAGELLGRHEEPDEPTQDSTLTRLNAIQKRFNILEQQIEPDNQENLRGAGELPGRHEEPDEPTQESTLTRLNAIQRRFNSLEQQILR